ncbi:unnamed protein product, partial [Meganyctiphanes norvegica]
GPMLPDLILDTPPPSPLRWAHSNHFTFPEKLDQKDLPITAKSLLPPGPYFPPPTHTSLPPTHSNTDDENTSMTTMSVELIQAVRRQILAEPDIKVPLIHQLPQLNWNVPLPTHVRTPKQESQCSQQNTEEENTWRTVGIDLRSIADKFYLDYVLVRGKRRHSNSGINLLVLKSWCSLFF